MDIVRFLRDVYKIKNLAKQTHQTCYKSPLTTRNKYKIYLDLGTSNLDIVRYLRNVCKMFMRLKIVDKTPRRCYKITMNHLKQVYN